ncbi:hypothetical protein [Streptomyces qinglanensis]|uniref:Uncharacterized protein n=1 Tax=Streptomyces qinglanensis TaxID=943816 RepID=A0A1H9RYT2_9ACTN|nr:hypothetical protein [Streptomyces qinglanensis]SER77283.1 hypothetical protein SAMN05421870_104121 [Streptomyces qinglanensis]
MKLPRELTDAQAKALEENAADYRELKTRIRKFNEAASQRLSAVGLDDVFDDPCGLCNCRTFEFSWYGADICTCHHGRLLHGDFPR